MVTFSEGGDTFSFSCRLHTRPHSPEDQIRRPHPVNFLTYVSSRNAVATGGRPLCCVLTRPKGNKRDSSSSSVPGDNGVAMARLKANRDFSYSYKTIIAQSLYLLCLRAWVIYEAPSAKVPPRVETIFGTIKNESYMTSSDVILHTALSDACSCRVGSDMCTTPKTLKGLEPCLVLSA